MKYFLIGICFMLFGFSFVKGQNKISGGKFNTLPNFDISLNTLGIPASSNLPIIVILTENGAAISDSPKIKAHMGIIYNQNGTRNKITDTYNDYDGQIGIELRGNSTQNFPKKPYILETRDSLGKNLNTSLLGMPKDNDWILLASYIDRTFIRDPLAHFLSASLGQWSSHSKFCELIVNGEYQGIYILIEKIKQGKNRVNIDKLNANEISGDSITGGYIYEVTGFGGNFGENRLLHYPKPDEVKSAQLTYITNYDNAFRNVMNDSNYDNLEKGYFKYIDPASFINEIIVQESMRNSDAYGWSSYFYKDKNKRIEAGPVWDFDQSGGNSSYPDDGVVKGWMFAHTGTLNTPFFWKKLLNEPKFRYMFRLRWEELRKEKYKTANILAFIDSCANLLSEAQHRNFEKWTAVLGQFVWRETTGYKSRNTYQKEVDYLKTFMTNRLLWIDQQVALIPEVSLYPAPSAAGIITGDTNVCTGTTNKTYKVTTITDATTYIWTLPAGATGKSSTNNITVSFGNTSISGNIKVKGHNDFGDGTESILSISVNKCSTYENENISTLNKINAYPNPSSGLVEISINELSEIDYKIEVFNLTGLIIQSISKRNTENKVQIDLSMYPSGLYFFKISSKNKLYFSSIIKK